MRPFATLFAAFSFSTAALALDAPNVSISTDMSAIDSTYTRLTWFSVPGASGYCVFGRNTYAGSDSLFVTTTDTTALIALATEWGFETPTKLGFFTVVADSAESSSGMTLVPAGTFMMGQSVVATPEHQVTLTNDFYLGTHEVTNQDYLDAVQWAYDHGHVTASSSTVTAYGQELLDLDDTNYCEIAFNSVTGQFYLVARTYNSGSWGPGYTYPDGYDPADHPVKEVSWYGAACYCDWQSQRSDPPLPAFYLGNWGQTDAHDPYEAAGYRLPTEAEWEFAAQFNDERTYPWGETAPNCDYANYNYCVGWTAPVGSSPLGNSALGMTDMAGNVWEWVGDWYGNYTSEDQQDPLGSQSGSSRVVRSGWYGSTILRCATRANGDPPQMYHFLGFRLCRTAD